ncbi:hypothetical protein [Nocardioides sp. HB32]
MLPPPAPLGAPRAHLGAGTRRIRHPHNLRRADTVLAGGSVTGVALAAASIHPVRYARGALGMTTREQARDAPNRAAAGPRLVWPAVIAVAAALVRLPFITRPLTPDEGGYMLVASQWSPGNSLYGAYFVDRPPLLIAIYGLANHLGSATGLRIIGLVAVVLAVALSARLAGTTGAVVCAALLSTPLFDGMEIDGELLAVPFVLGAFALLLRSVRANTDVDRHAVPFFAGVLTAAAVLVKQNMIDGIVVAVILLAGLALRRRWWDAVVRAVAFTAGAASAAVLVLVLADLRGTKPLALWDALVTFRAQAASVISNSAASTNADRFHTMMLAGLVAGIPMVLAAALLTLRRPLREPLLLSAAIATLVWEIAGALLGGSYWQHYLIAVVPGVVLLTAASDGGRWLRLAAGYAAACAALALVFAVQHPLQMSSDTRVATYIRAESRPGDTMMVELGHPNIVLAAGLQSPYEHLWSLTARVRDPQLADFTRLLTSPDAPRWVVVSGGSLATWGIDATHAQVVFDDRYREVTAAGDWHVFERTVFPSGNTGDGTVGAGPAK